MPRNGTHEAGRQAEVAVAPVAAPQTLGQEIEPIDVEARMNEHRLRLRSKNPPLQPPSLRCFVRSQVPWVVK